MDGLLAKISALEEELKAERTEKSRFRQLFIEAERALEKRQSAYVELEQRYGEERSRRIQLVCCGAVFLHYSLTSIWAGTGRCQTAGYSNH